MGKVVSHMTMSLDGFIADPQDGVEELFGWYQAGTVTVPSAADRWSFQAARELAGDKDVSVASADIAAQALDLGLVDEVAISLVPVLLGQGIPYFANLARAPHRFGDPVVIPGRGATHLRYAVRRP